MKTNPGTSGRFLKNQSSHFLCLLIPVYALAFVASGPHAPWVAFCWILPLWSTVLIDIWSPPQRAQPIGGALILPLDAVLYALAGLQFLTIALLMKLATQLNWASASEITASLVNLFAIKVIVGTSSSFSGIVVAHELIHRESALKRTIGRLLLSLECYEHFATEHIRGHHRNVGTQNDPATARLGESYEAFWKRTVPAQFKSAWKLENERLAIHGKTLNRKWLFHHVAQGVTLELVLLASIAWLFGPAGILVFLLQAYAAVRKLETINYIQHWGLTRTPAEKGTDLSWDTDSWFTLNTLVGLSRHSDHHRHALRPFHQLCYQEQTPKLPYGYFTLAFLSVWDNRRFQEIAIRQMNAHHLPGQEATG